ncbi:MAG: transcriptional regulator [Proteobacteria bacterium]|nr:transcriptional regulator [Pseudomonadota bacterium]
MNEKMLTIDVATLDEVKERMKAAFKGKPDDTPRYTFTSRESLLDTLTARRWALIEALTGAGPTGVRELARRVSRDIKGVHTDAQVLVLCGLVNKAADGKLHFPYNAVRVEFMAKAA